MEKIYNILNKIWFSLLYLFLCYKILMNDNVGFFQIAFLLYVLFALYSIFKNKDWVYKLTLFFLVWMNISLFFLSGTVKNEELKITYNLTSFEFILFVFTVIAGFLYYINRKKIITGVSNDKL